MFRTGKYYRFVCLYLTITEQLFSSTKLFFENTTEEQSVGNTVIKYSNLQCKIPN